MTSPVSLTGWQSISAGAGLSVGLFWIVWWSVVPQATAYLPGKHASPQKGAAAMSDRRPVPDEVKKNRRTILGKSIAAFQAAADSGDAEGAGRELAAMRALDLVVPDGLGGLATGPDVAD